MGRQQTARHMVCKSFVFFFWAITVPIGFGFSSFNRWQYHDIFFFITIYLWRVFTLVYEINHFTKSIIFLVHLHNNVQLALQGKSNHNKPRQTDWSTMKIIETKEWYSNFSIKMLLHCIIKRHWMNDKSIWQKAFFSSCFCEKWTQKKLW